MPSMKKSDTALTWDLSKLYSGLDDPQIEKDQKKADSVVDSFVTKYAQSSEWLSKPKALAEALIEYEKMILVPGSNASYYAYYRKDLNTEDKEAEALAARLDDRGTKRGNKLLFFGLKLGKVSVDMQNKFLSAPELKEFKYYLSELFKNSKHDLSEPEEKILSLKADVSHNRWIQATSNILDKQTVRWGGEELPLPKAESSYNTMPTAKRRKLYGLVRDTYEKVSDVAESELNAIYTNKKINDELRGYKTPYEATILGYQNDEKAVMSLVDAVTKHQDIAQRFYKIKAKLLKEKKLGYADRSAEVGRVSGDFSYVQARPFVHKVFHNLDPLFGELYEKLTTSRQVDVYPKKGKTGGAYCSSGSTTPTLVLLNHTDSFDSVKTLGHEMGHAIHAERSKTQRPFYSGHPISTAETASTFFEYATMHSLIETLPKSQQVIALHNMIQDDVATVFRQIAFFRFEQRLHDAVRTDGYVPKEKIAALMNEEMSAYLGPAFKLDPKDGYFFVTIGHIRRFFYVYSYAYGQLISKALHKELKKDKGFIKKVDQFLSSGECMSPEDIFASIGLDTRSPKIFEDGLASIADDVQKLEKLVK